MTGGGERGLTFTPDTTIPITYGQCSLQCNQHWQVVLGGKKVSQGCVVNWMQKYLSSNLSGRLGLGHWLPLACPHYHDHYQVFVAGQHQININICHFPGKHLSYQSEEKRTMPTLARVKTRLYLSCKVRPEEQNKITHQLGEGFKSAKQRLYLCTTQYLPLISQTGTDFKKLIVLIIKNQPKPGKTIEKKGKMWRIKCRQSHSSSC